MKNGKVALIEQARQLRIQAEALEKAVARGTSRRVAIPVVRPATQPEGTPEELLSMVQRMLTERPWYFSDMSDALGTRDKVRGMIMRLQRAGIRVVNLAPDGSDKALWFIPSDAVAERVLTAFTDPRG